MIGRVVIGLALTVASASAAPQSRAPDPETRAWWALASELSSDAMEGRDVGSAGYDRSAGQVAKHFAAAGLKPLGSDGSWLQPVPMHELKVETARVMIAGRPLRFLHDFTIQPTSSMPTRLSAPLVYAGYCAAETLGSVAGKIVICHGANRPGLPSSADRSAAAKAAGAAGIITIADPGFTVEPPRWPFAYARAAWIAGSPPAPDPMLRMTLNADALATVIAGGGQDARALVAAGSAGQPLPRFEVQGQIAATLTLRERDLSASNVLGMLPGTDPAMADQVIVLSAHLDGYGSGEPVRGDRLYNGTLDDAAYVALLIQLAQTRHGKGFRRPVIFAAFTGEEKGLLGSRWFVDHPTVEKSGIAANINLDQLRPIFPLELLTVHALDDTSLGDDARAVAAAMGVAVQRDPEPERNLLRRADQWPFLQAGIPATAFVFGYRPGTPSERTYRQWYRTGYHRPQDDPRQFIDWKAARDFNRFFFSLVERVADQAPAPSWKPGSTLRPKISR